MSTLGILNRNPGNIRYSPGPHGTAAFLGCIGSYKGFCVFDLAQHGIRAIGRILMTYQTKHGIRTIKDAINRWAPPTENDTAAYIVDVAHRAKINPEKVVDFRLPQVEIVKAIIWHENGSCPYGDPVIATALSED